MYINYIQCQVCFKTSITEKFNKILKLIYYLTNESEVTIDFDTEIWCF